MKAILIIDMPEACWEGCPCEYDTIWCQASDRHLIPATADESRPDWCLLRPLPERKDDGEMVGYTIGEPITEELANKLIDFGFDECLDAILKEEEEVQQ